MSYPKKFCWSLVTCWGISTVVLLLGFGFLDITPWVPIGKDEGWRSAILFMFFTGGIISAGTALHRCMTARS